MSIKIIILATVVALVAPMSSDGDKKYSHISHKENKHYVDIPHDYYAYPKYSFDYGVKDFKTGDYKMHKEERDGDVVKGKYTVSDPDGTIRTVTYTVTKHGGFQAVVKKSGNHHQEFDIGTSHEHETSGHKHKNEHDMENKMEENKAVDIMKKSMFATHQDSVNSVIKDKKSYVDTTKMKIEGKEVVYTMKNAAVSKSHGGNTGFNNSFDVMTEKKLEEKKAVEMVKKSINTKNYEYPVMEENSGRQRGNPGITMLQKSKENIPQYNVHSYDEGSQVSTNVDGKKMENKMLLPMKQKMMDMATQEKLYFVPYYYNVKN